MAISLSLVKLKSIGHECKCCRHIFLKGSEIYIYVIINLYDSTFRYVTKPQSRSPSLRPLGKETEALG